jgi:acetyl-CoA acetyltransferase
MATQTLLRCIAIMGWLVLAAPGDAEAGAATMATPIDCVHFIAMDQGTQRSSIDAAMAGAPLELTGSDQVDVVSVERACLQGSGTLAAAVDRVRNASSPNTLLLDGSGHPLKLQ